MKVRVIQKYDPNQPRDPGGPGGGQWIAVGGGDFVEPEAKPFKARPDMTPEELEQAKKDREVYDRYAKTFEGSHDVNNGLRGNQPMTEDALKLIADLDEIYARDSGTTNRQDVYRAISVPEDSAFLARLAPGAVMTDPAFLSTSFEYEVAERRTTHPERPTDPGVFLNIRVPRGSKVITGDSFFEAEMLFPRGSSLKINKVERKAKDSDWFEEPRSNDLIYVDADYIPPGYSGIQMAAKAAKPTKAAKLTLLVNLETGELLKPDVTLPLWPPPKAAAPATKKTTNTQITKSGGPRMQVIRKTAIADPVGLDYVLSDASVDRYGDAVDPAGWVLTAFQSNPIALFNHDINAPIGRWENLRVAGGKLVGRLVLAAEGTSARIDELRRLIEQGILRAVSVGFKPLREPERMSTGRGVRYRSQELLECSLVSVPANPNALQVARALNLSDETVRLVFGQNANGHVSPQSGLTGKHAENVTPSQRAGAMNLSEMITKSQERLAELRTDLQTQIEAAGDTPDDGAIEAQEELQRQIDEEDRKLKNWQAAESRLASTAQIITPEGGGDVRKPFALPTKKVEPLDYMFRALTVMVKHHGDKNRVPIADILKQTYGEDVATKAVLDFVSKAATVPATTTGVGWADTLVQTAIGDFIESLAPLSVYPKLSAKGARLTFGRNGRVSLPSRSPTPSIGGSFVGQGAPIPVRQAAFSAISLTPKKMGVITTMTREIMEHSTPAIESILRTAILEDTAVAIDSVLLDAVNADMIRPAGIRNGVTANTPTAGGGFNALVGDMKALIGDLLAGSNGQLRSPVWIMNPVEALSISLTQNTGGDFPFAAEINGGNFRGYPVIVSPTCTVGMVILLDAADFFSATGDDPRFDVSDQAVLHMEDTAPQPIGSTGTPSVVAAPVRSLWQTDTLGIRMLLDINWAFRRPGTVSVVTGVTW